MKTAAELLQEAWRASGLTQHRLADRLRVPRRTFERYLRGETKKVPAEVVIAAQAISAKKRR